ncbi:MAG TPA: serpin family protein, partial [Saprospiraceae bacterium]|nr:serpin family protein [Saprospiraceae bacterium]
MNAQYIFPFYLILFLVFVSSCKKVAVDNIPNPIDPTEVKNIANMNQQFGWELFQKELAANPDKNVLISPWSVQTALQMALNGADHNTLSEMLKTIACDNCNVDEINKQQALLTTLMEKQGGKAILTSANGLFYDTKRLTVFDPFMVNIKQYYSADPHQYDFDKAEESKTAINKWVKDKTNGKIDGIVETINHYDIAFLINAIHFKADWLKAFDPKLTYKADFTTKSGSKVEANFVTGDDEFNAGTDGLYNMIDIPFIDSTYSVAFIQAVSNAQDPEWSNKIDNAITKGLFSNLHKGRIILKFPKLKLDYKNDLIKTLEALG